MGNPYPANFESLSGSGRLTGQINFTDSNNQPGGSQTYQSRASYSGDPVTVTDGTEGYLTWDSLGSGAALLDLTAPTQPTVVAGGIYAVSLNVEAQAFLTANGTFQATLHLDANGDDAVGEVTAGNQGTTEFPIVNIGCTYYIPPGGLVEARLHLEDGVANRAFRIREAIIQLLPGGP